MHAIVKALKGAVARGAGTPIMGCYVVRDGHIYAQNGIFQVAVPMVSDVSFAVPAHELEAALDRMATVTALEYSGESITVRGGRLRATIQCQDGEPPALPPLPAAEAWRPVPPGLCRAMELALPFCGEHGYTAGLRLAPGHVTAISNVRGIDVEVPGLDCGPVMLAHQTVEYLIAQGGGDQMAVTPTALFSRWADNRWLRSQLLADVMPGSVDAIFTSCGDAAPIALTREWCEAFADASALSAEAVEFDATGLHGRKGAARADVDCPVDGLPDGFASLWKLGALDPILACATHWNPAAHPLPVLFIGDGLRGCVIGMRV